jgi:hypothetical protein
MKLASASLGSIAALAIGLPSASASAEVITFNNLATGNCAVHAQTVTSGSFTFSANDTFYICNPGVVGNNPMPALLDANGQSIITMSQTGGGAFSLNSFFAGTRNQPQWYALATGIEVVGNLAAGGTVSQTITFDGTAWGEHFLNSSFTGLSSVRLSAISSGNNSEFLIDDIRVNEAFQSAVPEPATWAMLILGFGVVGSALRTAKRKQLTVSYA